ncbi:MAG: type I methionyl aminopeptidase [Myxococcota bacterium]
MIAQRIPIKTRREIDRMRESGRHVAEILLLLREKAKPGMTTGELNEIAAAEIERRGIQSSFLGYGPGGLPPYPAVLCVSVNDEVVHGIPGKRQLKEGDLLSLDFGITTGGFHGDSACTIPVGEVDDDARDLMETTRDSLYDAIDQMRPGNRLSDIGHAVQTRAESKGYEVVRQFVGHGIGRVMHELPQIPNYGRPGRGPRLLSGMVFAIEPMVNMGSENVKMLEDEWTAVTEDGEISAHFEHTVLISDNGPEVLTSVEGSH